MSTPFYLLRVLESELPPWLALGWIDDGQRDHIPSVDEPIVVIRWNGESPRLHYKVGDD